MPRIVNALDAARMTALTSRETAHRVSLYFGDAGPFSYGRVRSLTALLLAGALPYHVATAGLEKIKFDLARRCNLDVAKLIAECTQFHGKSFYKKFKKLLFAIDRDFALGIKPEAVAVVDGVPNLIFLQPRKNATPWAYSAAFLRRVIEETLGDYFEDYRIWLLDTEALEGSDREMKLVDLQLVPAMQDSEFRRRIAALRQAWRLYLKEPRSKGNRPGSLDDLQWNFGFGDDE